MNHDRARGARGLVGGAIARASVRCVLRAAVAAVAGGGVAGLAAGQQVADPEFKPVVARAMHAGGDGPRVFIDAGHHNFHTADGRYKPFAELLRADGCRVMERTGVFDEASMPASGEVLVIANALGAARMNDAGADAPAFTDAECAAVMAWVKEGGRLLLVADHAPFGAATESLGRALGVTMSKGWLLDLDEANRAGGSATVTTPATPAPTSPTNPTFLRFSRDNGLLGDHAITRGRDESERLNTVVTFTGQGLRGPEGSVAFLKLSPTSRNAETRQKIREIVTSAGLVGVRKDGGVDDPREKQPREQRGGELLKGADGKVAEGDQWNAQGLAFELGKGRVVVMGEAACMTAQAVNLPANLAGAAGEPAMKMGMNVAGSDDLQMTLNIVRWLAGEIGEK